MKERSERRKNHRSQRLQPNQSHFPRRVWDAQVAGMRRTALLGFGIGVALGCLFGAVLSGLPGQAEKGGPEALSVNQSTGKPQLHIKGKPEIK